MVKGKALPDVYKDLPEQAARIIQQIRLSLTEANNYYDSMPDTWKEWDRLRQDNTFKNEARPEYIYSFDAFVEEFGICTDPKQGHLKKINKAHTTWNKHNTMWSNRKR